MRASGHGVLGSGDDRTIRIRAGWLALIAGTLIGAAKFVAYEWTGSYAILSDALESIVNVAAAAFALASVSLAAEPADENHPYGHGKIEFVSAAFEGGLILFAALAILFETMSAIGGAHELRALDAGLVVVAAAGIANAALGSLLLSVGRRLRSPALEADGQHVLSDFWTSAGVVAGLWLVWLTGFGWLDLLIAGLVAIHLIRVGTGLVRDAFGGLMDELDPSVVARLAEALEAARRPGIIAVHRLRTIRQGADTHADAHLVVPRFWTVSQAHEASDAFESRVTQAVAGEAELVFHLDPCTPRYCSGCAYEPCPVRESPFEGREELTPDTVVADDPE